MMKPPLLRFFAVMALLTATHALRGSDATFVDLGDNTYSCTHEAVTTFNRDVDKLVEAATSAVAEFCAKRGREPKLVSITVDKPWVAVGIPKATVVFKPLEPGDPELAEPAPVPVVRKGIKGKTERAAPMKAQDDLYRTLLNLDDLRKKGILTEEEFQAEKKKVLARSK